MQKQESQIEMCGIAGYVGEGQAVTELLPMMEAMEYRGYDSAGVAIINNGDLTVRKGCGLLSDVIRDTRMPDIVGQIGIGHVRWATHGKVTVDNAHPHTDCKRMIAVVHNGVIDNYRELKCGFLRSHVFCSQTDSEVIAHIIEDRMGEGHTILDAVAYMMEIIVGDFAIALACKVVPDTLVAVRRNAPLMVGRAQNGMYVASDVLAFGNGIKSIAECPNGVVLVIQEHEVREIS